MKRINGKGRKLISNLKFNLKKFTYENRIRFERTQENITFKRSIIKIVLKSLFKNIVFILFLIILEQLLVSKKVFLILPYNFHCLPLWFSNINKVIMSNINIFSEILSVIVGAAGVFLGLYCSNIMSMYSEKYVNATQNISRVYENDILTNKCIKMITDYILFSIIVLFLSVVQVKIGFLILLVTIFKGFEIIVSFGFMSRRTYQFSDTYYITNSVFDELYKILDHLKKDRYFLNDINFQYYYRNLAKNKLEVLMEINEFNLNKKSDNLSNNIVNFMQNIFCFLNEYWKKKKRIPDDSYWYDDKIYYKKWYKSSDYEIISALCKGSMVPHETTRNHLWIEEVLMEIMDRSFGYLVSNNKYLNVLKWIGFIKTISTSVIESGNFDFYVDYLYKIQKSIQNDFVPKVYPVEIKMAFAEYVIVNYLNFLVEVRKYVENEENFLHDIKSFEKSKGKPLNQYYRYLDIRKLYDNIDAEIKIEGKRITPDWYIKQALAKHCYDDLIDIYIKIDVIVNKYITGFVDNLFEQNDNAGTVIAIAKYNEILSKLYYAENSLKKRLEWLLTFYKDKNSVWQEIPQMDIYNKFKSTYNKIFPKWCRSTMHFVKENWNSYNKYPDVLGACYMYLCELLIETIETENFEIFKENYENLFEIMLLYYEYCKQELYSITNNSQNIQTISLCTNPIVEFGMISGYAYLWGELSNDSRWKDLVLSSTNNKIAKGNYVDYICQILQAVSDNFPFICSHDILHNQWIRRMNIMFEEKGKISWKESHFRYEYDGDSKLLKLVLNNKGNSNFLKYNAYEIYAIVVLNRFLSVEKRYHARNRWETKYEK